MQAKMGDALASKRHQGSWNHRAVVPSTADGKTVVWKDAVWPRNCGLVAGNQMGGIEQNEAISGETSGATPHPAFYSASVDSEKESNQSFTNNSLNLFCMNWMLCF